MNEDRIDQSKLDALAAAVAGLPRSMEPPEDFWPAIRAGIASTPVRVVAWWQRPAILAVAALVLVAGSSLATLAVVRGSASRVGTPTASAVETSARGSDATLAQFTRVETDYIRTVNELSAALEARQSELAPGTIVKLRQSLRVIDAAIVEARAALAADPSNKTLTEMLSASYEQKVDLIRRTTEMARS